MIRHVVKFIAGLSVSWALVSCDQPTDGHDLLFYGECVGNEENECVTLELEGTDLSPHVTRNPILSSQDFLSVEIFEDPSSDQYGINIQMNERGTRRFGEATTSLRGKSIYITHGGQLVTASVVREPILGGKGQILVGSEQEARQLVADIRDRL